MAFFNNRTEFRKTAFVVFIEGCSRSVIEGFRLLEYLKKNNWVITTNLKQAKLILLGTCGVTLSAEEKSIRFVSITRSQKAPDAKIVIFGCLAAINPQRLKKFGAIPISPKNFDELDDITGAAIKIKDIDEVNIINQSLDTPATAYSLTDRLYITSQRPIRYLPNRFFSTFFRNRPLHEKYEKIFNIRVARGCLGECTYCAIKFLVDQIHSKPPDNIISEFQSGLKQNYSVFRLIGEDIGAYGQDTGTNIVDLLSNICSQPGNFKLIWDDFNPNWLIKYFPQLLEIFRKHGSKFGYMGFPVQSGSEKILKLMRRNYTAAEAKECLLAIKKAMPTLKLSTHFLIGFPGETKADVRDTINFAKTVKFNHALTFIYEDRPNAIAAQLPNHVPWIKRYLSLFLLRKNLNAISLTEPGFSSL